MAGECCEILLKRERRGLEEHVRLDRKETSALVQRVINGQWEACDKQMYENFPCVVGSIEPSEIGELMFSQERVLSRVCAAGATGSAASRKV